MNKPYLETLTPLRGIAALLVVVFHTQLMLGPFIPEGITMFFKNGWLMVDFFFILSGFIMSYVYNDTFALGLTRSSYWKYVGARFARIYPLHLVTLFWSLVCAIFIRHFSEALHPIYASIFNPMATPACLLLIQSLHVYVAAPLNTSSWSICTEWWTYMLFPFLVPLFVKNKFWGRITLAFLIILFYLFIKYVLGPASVPFPNQSINVHKDFGLFRCIAGFLTGMLLCEFYKNEKGFLWLRKSSAFTTLSLGCLLAMHFDFPDICILAFFPFLILSAAYNSGLLKKLLLLQPFQKLGDWSFSIYMVHVPMIQTVFIFQVMKNPMRFALYKPPLTAPPDYLFNLGLCGALLGTALIVASVTHRYVEVKARILLNSYFRAKKSDIANVNTEWVK